MIRFGLVGCGKIAERHAALLADGCVSNACLQAVCDVAEPRAREFASKYGVKPFSDLHAMGADPEVDAFTVLTPSGFHASNVVELARHGKPIIVEKPMALTMEDADAMIEACNKHGASLFVVKQNRFNKPIMALREAIDAGRFGKLVLGTVRVRWCRPQSYYDAAKWRGTWAVDGGVLSNQASHHIDLLNWLMGGAESVNAVGTTALAKIETEDTALATLRFKNGALGLVEATTAARPKDLEGSLSILGEKGSVEVGGFSANELKTWSFSEPIPSDTTVFETSGKNPVHKQGYAHAAYYEHVVASIAAGKPGMVDGPEGRKSLGLIAALYESMETGNTIRIGDPTPHCRLGKSA